MAHPPKIRRDIRVFISAVSKELGSVRKLAKASLEAIDYHPVEQDAFPPSYRELLDKLRERIASCDAMVHIVGKCYGAEPDAVPEGTPRRSYTQWEYVIAKELQKPVYVFLTSNEFPADPCPEEPLELQLLQQAYRDQLMLAGQDCNPTASRDDLQQKVRALQLKVERLQQELSQVDDRVEVANRSISVWGTSAVLTSLVSLALLATLIYQFGRESEDRGTRLQQVQAEVTSKVVEELMARLQAARAEADRIMVVPDGSSAAVPNIGPKIPPVTEYRAVEEAVPPQVYVPPPELVRNDPQPKSLPPWKGLPNGLVVFQAAWCGPCQRMLHSIEQLKQDGYPIQTVDADQHPALLQQFEVFSLPTILTVVEHQVIASTSGYMKPEDLRALASAAEPERRFSMPNVLK